MEVTIKDRRFKTGRLDAIQQFHVARRIAPILSTFMASVAAKQMAEIEQMPESAMLSLLVSPAMAALAEMPQDDADYVIQACLRVCEREEPGGWQRMIAPNGRLVFEETDLATILQLVIAVVKENLGAFFPDPNALGEAAPKSPASTSSASPAVKTS